MSGPLLLAHVLDVAVEEGSNGFSPLYAFLVSAGIGVTSLML